MRLQCNPHIFPPPGKHTRRAPAQSPATMLCAPAMGTGELNVDQVAPSSWQDPPVTEMSSVPVKEMPTEIVPPAGAATTSAPSACRVPME